MRDKRKSSPPKKHQTDPLRYFESMDKINHAMQGKYDLNEVMKDVLDALLSVFECDRAWLVYPCDPDAATWQTPMERTRPEFPGVLPIGVELPLDPVGAAVYRILRNADGPVQFGPKTQYPVPTEIAGAFQVQSFIAMAFYPKVGKPWSFGLHQCSYVRFWTAEEELIFKEAGRRLSDTLTSLLMYRDLQESEKKYRNLIQKIQAAVVVHGANTQILTSNSIAQQLLGVTEDQILGKTADDSAWQFSFEDGSAMPPEKYPINLVLASRKALRNYNVRVHHPKKEDDIWALVNADPVFDEEGEIVQVIVTFIDITEQKLVEKRLGESENRLRLTLEATQIAIWDWDIKNDLWYASPIYYTMLGYEPKAGFGDRDEWLERLHPEDRADVYGKIQDVLSRDFKEYRYEARMRHANGSYRWQEVMGFGIERDADGKVTRMLGIRMDITERKNHEREREAIITVSTALRQATTRTDILNIILDQLINLFDADGAMLVLPDPKTNGFIDEMGRGMIAEKMVGLRIPPEKGVCNWVIKNKKPYLNNHAKNDSIFYQPELLGESDRIASVPLVAQEEAIGALWIARRMDLREEDLRLLNAIANIAANALHRVILHEQTEQQLHHLAALHQIDIAITTNLDLNVTLYVILDHVKNELDVDAAGILLLSPINRTLDFAAGIGFKTRNIENSHVELTDQFAGVAAQEQHTVSCADLNLDGDTFSRSTLLAGEEFIMYFATPLLVKGQVKGVLELFHRKPMKPDTEWISYFETLATQAAIAIESASLVENLQQSNMELTMAYDATIEGWSRALDLRDRETEGHTQRVTDMALALAEKMGFNEAEKMNLRRGALLHDIGKMGVPDLILLKPGPLSEEETEIMRQHPTYAYQMLSPITYLKNALDICYCHHEKWDGSGYPRGLKGEEIPLSARLFAVVDVFDALTTDRPYRSAWPREEVYQYIEEQAGKHFDPKIVKIFLEDEP